MHYRREGSRERGRQMGRGRHRRRRWCTTASPPRVASRARCLLASPAARRRLASGLELEGLMCGIDPGQEQGKGGRPNRPRFQSGPAKTNDASEPDQIWKQAHFVPIRIEAVSGLTERGLRRCQGWPEWSRRRSRSLHMHHSKSVFAMN